MRLVLLVIPLLTAGCFSTPEATPTTESAPQTPAVRAQAELGAMQTRFANLPQTQRTTLQRDGALLSRSDPGARAAVTLTMQLHSSLSTDPAMQVSGTFAATAPRLAERVASLRAALASHDEVLRTLRMLPLPPPTAEIAAELPSPAVVQAAIELEAATDGQWPMKRVYIAYALELEAIADEARQLAECGQTCPDGINTQAAALAAEADRLANLLAEFAALYC